MKKKERTHNLDYIIVVHHYNTYVLQWQHQVVWSPTATLCTGRLPMVPQPSPYHCHFYCCLKGWVWLGVPLIGMDPWFC